MYTCSVRDKILGLRSGSSEIGGFFANGQAVHYLSLIPQKLALVLQESAAAIPDTGKSRTTEDIFIFRFPSPVTRNTRLFL